jgi:hypothetical protein
VTRIPKFSLDQLREIGWEKWDPIGVGGPAEGWPADEYDTYLLHAATLLWSARPVDEVARYLVEIETKHMELSAAPGIEERAREVATAIRDYVESLHS